MEFPETGIQCKVHECKQLDFLPVQCDHCKENFCKDHCSPENHNCESYKDNFVIEKKVLKSYRCNQENCKTADVVEMLCTVCSQHFCLSHRHHGCLDKTPSQAKRDKLRAPREEFKKAKAETDKFVQERLKSAKNRALANKIKLMKIKGSAVGDNHIPSTDRLYFCVTPPLLGKETTRFKNIFVSRNWTWGKCIDAFAKRFKVNEGYDATDAPKLRLFDLEGRPIPGLLSDQVTTLIEIGTLVDGDSMILEYVPADELNNDLYDALMDKEILAKYIFV